MSENEIARLSERSRLKSPDGNIDIRIIYINESGAAICNLKKSGLDIYYESSSELINQLKRGGLFIVEENSNCIVDPDKLPEHSREMFLRNREIMNRIAAEYGPDYITLSSKVPKPLIKQLMEEYNLSNAGLWKIIRKYIRSGFNDVELTDQRGNRNGGYMYTTKTGRPSKYSRDGKALTKDDFANFDKYVSVYLRGNNITVKDAYRDLIADCYSIDVVNEDRSVSRELLPPEQRPSSSQFSYYLKKKTSPEQRKKAKMGEDQYRNDARILTGSSMDNVKGPGNCVEIDAHEMDVSMVSREYKDGCVGRPILYLMIDVYTRIILAVSVAMNNNSVVALTNVFYNLCEDKAALLAEYGISFSGKTYPENPHDIYTIDDVWPTNMKPERIRVDHGSDFISKQFDRILGELNITMDLVPPKTGSMKGIVEHIFAEIEQRIKDLFEGKGGIDPKHDSKHHKQATINIEDARKIMYNYVLEHNQHYMLEYEPSVYMLENGIDPRPCILWKTGCRQKIGPHHLPDRDSYIYSLMIPTYAKVARDGINWEERRYFNFEDEALIREMQAATGSGKKMKVRYDPRDVGHLYYLREGRLMMAELNAGNPNNRDYFGISYEHSKELKEKKKKRDAEGRESNLKDEINFRRTTREIIKEAERRKDGPVDTKGMRERREEEKAAVSAEHSFAAKAGITGPSDEMKKAVAEKLTEETDRRSQASEIPLTLRETGDTQEDVRRKMAAVSSEMLAEFYAEEDDEN